MLTAVVKATSVAEEQSHTSMQYRRVPTAPHPTGGEQRMKQPHKKHPSAAWRRTNHFLLTTFSAASAGPMIAVQTSAHRSSEMQSSALLFSAIVERRSHATEAVKVRAVITSLA